MEFYKREGISFREKHDLYQYNILNVPSLEYLVSMLWIVNHHNGKNHIQFPTNKKPFQFERVFKSLNF